MAFISQTRRHLYDKPEPQRKKFQSSKLRQQIKEKNIRSTNSAGLQVEKMVKIEDTLGQSVMDLDIQGQSKNKKNVGEQKNGKKYM